MEIDITREVEDPFVGNMLPLNSMIAHVRNEPAWQGGVIDRPARCVRARSLDTWRLTFVLTSLLWMSGFTLQPPFE